MGTLTLNVAGLTNAAVKLRVGNTKLTLATNSATLQARGGSSVLLGGNLITLLDSNAVPRLEVAANTTAIYAPNGTLAEVITADGTAYFATNVFITNGVLHLGSASLVLSNSPANTVFYEGGVAVLDLRTNSVTIATNLIVTGTLTGDGAGLTNLTAASIGTGTIPDALLSSNVMMSSDSLSVGYTTRSGFARFANGFLVMPPLRSGYITNSGDNFLSRNSGVWVVTPISVADSQDSVFTTLTFSNLVAATGGLGITATNLYSLSLPAVEVLNAPYLVNSPLLTNISMPKLRWLAVSTSWQLWPNNLINFDLRSLETITGGYINLMSAALTEISMPKLRTGAFRGNGTPSVRNIDLGSYETTQGLDFYFDGLEALTNFTAPKFRSGTVSLTGTMTNLARLSLPALTNGGVVLSSSVMTNITCPALIYWTALQISPNPTPPIKDVVFGTPGTLKSALSPITLSGMALSQGTVNYLLALLVTLDGSNGTTLWGTGKTLSIGGGTSAAPSG